MTRDARVPRETSTVLRQLAEDLDHVRDPRDPRDPCDPRDRQEVIARFWAGPGSSSPTVERESTGELLVTFLFLDPRASHVLVTINRVTESLGDSRMEQLRDTGIWTATFRLNSDWRGSYAFLPLDDDGMATLEALPPRHAMRRIREEGVLDPRNPHLAGTHGGGRISVAAMTEAPRQPWIEPAPSDVDKGAVTAMQAPSGRRVWVYEPHAVGPKAPVVVALDGQGWHSAGYIKNSMDRLIAAGQVEPAYAVMVDSGDVQTRMRDLSYDGGMSTWIVDELLPWMRSRYEISEAPEDIVVTGESLGGLTAMKTALLHPGTVGGALSQSASLWQHDMLDLIGSVGNRTRLFMTVGVREGILVPPHRKLVTALKQRAAVGRVRQEPWWMGAEPPTRHTYVEYNGGHDMACWRGFWAEGVRNLLNEPRPRPTTGSAAQQEGIA